MNRTIPPGPSRRIAVIAPIAVAVAIFVFLAVILGRTEIEGQPAEAGAAAAEQELINSTQLRLAYNVCGHAELADNDHTSR